MSGFGLSIKRMICSRTKRRSDQQAYFEDMMERCESPIERSFWSASYRTLDRYGFYRPQAVVAAFRLDFGLTIHTTPEIKIGVECDGLDFHTRPEQVARDKRRDRLLVVRGWTVIRFTGSEIYADAERCVGEVENIVRQRILTAGHKPADWSK